MCVIAGVDPAVCLVRRACSGCEQGCSGCFQLPAAHAPLVQRSPTRGLHAPASRVRIQR